MSDPTLDKAATRIQASYRGYKTRKELGSSSGPSNVGPDQHHPSSTSPESHNDYDSTRNKSSKFFLINLFSFSILNLVLSPSAEGNKEPEQEEDDNAAAVKIQVIDLTFEIFKFNFLYFTCRLLIAGIVFEKIWKNKSIVFIYVK